MTLKDTASMVAGCSVITQIFKFTGLLGLITTHVAPV